MKKMFTFKEGTFFNKSNFYIVAVFEALVFVTVTLLIDGMFFNGTRFFNVSFHPFWFIVLFLTLRYGLETGLITVVIASMALYLGNDIPQRIGENDYDYILRLSFNPIMWLLFVFFIGVIRNKEISLLRMLKTRVNTIEHKIKEIATEYSKAIEFTNVLEEKIAGQSQTIFTVYDAVKNMETSNIATILSGGGALLQSIVSPLKYSIFLLNADDDMEVKVMNGWDISDDYPKKYEKDSPLYELVITEGKTLCITNAEDEMKLDKGVFACPLILNGKTFGMIKIEKMNFTSLTAKNIASIRVVAEWISKAIAEFKKFDFFKQQSMIDPETNIMSGAFYSKQARFLAKLSERCNFSTSAILLKIAKDNMSRTEKSDFSKALADAVYEYLRKTDMVFISPKESVDYAILLPTTDVKGAKIVLDKMLEHLKNSTPYYSRITPQVLTIFESV